MSEPLGPQSTLSQHMGRSTSAHKLAVVCMLVFHDTFTSMQQQAMQVLTHPCIDLPTLSCHDSSTFSKDCIHSFIHPAFYPFIHPFIQTFTAASMYPFCHRSIHSCICSDVNSYIQSFCSFVCSRIHQRTCIHLFVHSFIWLLFCSSIIHSTCVQMNDWIIHSTYVQMKDWIIHSTSVQMNDWMQAHLA